MGGEYLEINPSPPKAAPLTFVIVQPPICSPNRVEVGFKTQGQKGRQKQVWHGNGGCCLHHHTCPWVSVVKNEGETETMKAERTVRELEEVREREEEKSRQGGNGDCSLETGGRWKAEGLPFSWR